MRRNEQNAKALLYTTSRLTLVPYASNIRPVNVPNKYRRNTCRDPMNEIVDEDEDGRSVVS